MYVEKSFAVGHPRSARGFTLIELMITITIAGILLAIAIPSMRDMIHQNRLAGHVNEFVAANMLARSEAIKRGNTVTLCPSASAESATACTTGVSDWSTGWLVIAQDPVDASKIEILTRQGALPAGTTVISALGSVVYNGMGQPVLAATSASTGFTFSNDCRLSGRQVDIGRTGRTDVSTIAATC